MCMISGSSGMGIVNMIILIIIIMMISMAHCICVSGYFSCSMRMTTAVYIALYFIYCDTHIHTMYADYPDKDNTTNSLVDDVLV